MCGVKLPLKDLVQSEKIVQCSVKIRGLLPEAVDQLKKNLSVTEIH